MNLKNTYAFTLVELIVVITILTILGTIAYTSFLWYSQSARNSHRVSDIKVIEKAMGLFISIESSYPTPDNPTTISYNGKPAWIQWVFATGAIIQVKAVSEIPKDPLVWAQYTYSILSNGSRYQVWAALERWFLSYSSPWIPQSYAISSNNFLGYIIGDYLSYDVNVSDWTSCNLITAPSILLSDIPAWWVIHDGSVYNYSYRKSSHLPNSYSGFVDISTPWNGFQIAEVLNVCNISSIPELELYIAQLSTSYQQLSSLSKYEKLIFHSNTIEFQLESIEDLQEKWITVSDSIIKTLHSPLSDKVFTDAFSDTNGTLIEAHTPSSIWSWSMISGGNSSSYTISWNILKKSGNSYSLIYPIPSPIISSIDYSVSFDILDFSGGDISIYLRYQDSDNYYKLSISSSGYILSRRMAWVDATFQNIVELINVWSNVVFSVSWDSLVFSIDGVEKENILAWGISSVWKPIIHIQNSWATIDNYTLNYK